MEGTANFVNGGIVQSTLREMKALGRSRNLWLTFGGVVLLFALTGPFGTYQSLPLVPRLGYWLVLHACAWAVALTFVVAGDVALRGRMESLFWRMMTGSLLSAIPIGVITELIEYAWLGTVPTLESVLMAMLLALPLCAIFCTITYLAMSNEKVQARLAPQMPPADTALVTEPPASREPPLLSRLKPENRGRLLHIEVEDHYTLVRTSRGRELLLMRFSDVLRETEGAEGLQVHRSHWVAAEFVTGIRRDGSRLVLTLGDGSEVPVSRTYAAEVRQRFG